MIRTKALRALLLVFGLAASASADLVNPGFEDPAVLPGTVNFPVTIPGWQTTDIAFEIWGTGFNGVPSYEGNQFAEINAFRAGTLSQDASGIAAGSQLGFTFAHRGRAGVDTMRLTITDLGSDNAPGGGNDTVLFTKTYSTGNSAWAVYDGTTEAPIFALGNTIRFAYAAISTATGNTSVGNFLDAANFGVGPGVPVHEPGALGLLLTSGLVVAWRRRRTA